MNKRPKLDCPINQKADPVSRRKLTSIGRPSLFTRASPVMKQTGFRLVLLAVLVALAIGFGPGSVSGSGSGSVSVSVSVSKTFNADNYITEEIIGGDPTRFYTNLVRGLSLAKDDFFEYREKLVERFSPSRIGITQDGIIGNARGMEPSVDRYLRNIYSVPPDVRYQKWYAQSTETEPKLYLRFHNQKMSLLRKIYNEYVLFMLIFPVEEQLLASGQCRKSSISSPMCRRELPT